MQSVYFRDLGRMRYREAWDYQTQVHKTLVEAKAERRQNPEAPLPPHQLLFVEHPHVYTLGRSGSSDNLLLTEAEMQARDIDYFPINRGGDITYHGPGQLVGYPVLDLDRFFTDVHRYVRNIEEVMILTLSEFGLKGFRIPEYTGVWVEDEPSFSQGEDFWRKKRKICAIGVHLSRWVTLHGWAFNVNSDLDYFKNIVPCGIVDEDKTVTSMHVELGRPVDFEEIKQIVRRRFAEVFECDITL